MTTLREFVMLQFMNGITDKPNWHIKVGSCFYSCFWPNVPKQINNPEIAAKWKNEALGSNDIILPTRWQIDGLKSCNTRLRWFQRLLPARRLAWFKNGDVVE